MDTANLYNYLDALNNTCTRCNLGPCIPVTHRGNLNADIMLIGEGLGKVEEEQRTCFVGPAGQLLDKMFNNIGLDTNTDMLLSNCLMARPKAPEDSNKQNLTPTEEQLDACFPYVRNLIRIVKPKVIIACGRIALGELLNDRKVKLKEYEGKWIEYKANYDLVSPNEKETFNIQFNIPMFVMCHPSYILHQTNYMDKNEFTELKNKVKNYLNEFKIKYNQLKGK